MCHQVNLAFAVHRNKFRTIKFHGCSPVQGASALWSVISHAMRGASLTRGASVTGTAPAALGAAGWRADAGASTSTRSEPDARSFSQFASDTTASAVASATTVASVGWSLPGQLHPHVRCFSVSRGCTADAAGGAAGAGGGAGGGEKRMSLGEALNTLVDAAIEKVGACVEGGRRHGGGRAADWLPVDGEEPLLATCLAQGERVDTWQPVCVYA